MSFIFPLSPPAAMYTRLSEHDGSHCCRRRQLRRAAYGHCGGCHLHTLHHRWLLTCPSLPRCGWRRTRGVLLARILPSRVLLSFLPLLFPPLLLHRQIHVDDAEGSDAEGSERHIASIEQRPPSAVLRLFLGLLPLDLLLGSSPLPFLPHLLPVVIAGVQRGTVLVVMATTLGCPIVCSPPFAELPSELILPSIVRYLRLPSGVVDTVIVHRHQIPIAGQYTQYARHPQRRLTELSQYQTMSLRIATVVKHLIESAARCPGLPEFQHLRSELQSLSMIPLHIARVEAMNKIPSAPFHAVDERLQRSNLRAVNVLAGNPRCAVLRVIGYMM